MANEKVDVAKQRMDDAERALRDFIEQKDRTFSVKEIKQHLALADRLTRAIAEYLKAEQKNKKTRAT